jgi:hypothetical protein
MDYLGFGQSESMRLLPKLIGNQSSVTRANRHTSSGMNLSSIPINPTTTSSVLKRDCNVHVDPKHVSDRHEWATAHYHSYYNPHCLFELEIRWLVAASCILAELISHWSQRTGAVRDMKQAAFHLVSIPCDPFAEFDPLRGKYR